MLAVHYFKYMKTQQTICSLVLAMPGISSSHLFIYFFYHAHKKQSLPTALLHLIGCDWLCPEAFASFSVTA